MRRIASTAPEHDVWEYDRQQNIIDSIDAAQEVGTYGAADSPEQATANKRRAEALAIQNYLVKKNVASDEVNKAVDAVDTKWVSENPPPKDDTAPSAPVPESE